MAETIYTIPINETFDRLDGCPLCRLRADLEKAALDYVLGAAMMEPDVRLRTNALGFCREHYDAMLGMKNRLGLALILESHLEQVRLLLRAPEEAPKRRLGGKKAADSLGDALGRAAGSCFICDRVHGFMEKYLSNVIYLWKSDAAFREKLGRQPFFCLEHAGALLEAGEQSLSGGKFQAFSQEVLSVVSRRAAALAEDLGGFTRSFDHRFAGQPLTEAQRQSVENLTDLLAGK